MLKVNVGMSRKLTRDYNSTGFSVNVEGEVLASPDDPEMVLEKIKELYDLAEESLIDQLKRHSDDSDHGRYVGHGQPETAAANSTANNYPGVRTEPRPSVGRNTSSSRAANGQANTGKPQTEPNGNSSGQSTTNATPATNKQIQFLLTLGKQRGLTKKQLEEDITEIVGRSTEIYELTKTEAGLALDRFTNGMEKSSRSRR